MKTTWTKGLKGEEKKEIADSFSSSSRIRNKQVELLRDKIETADKTALSKEGYECPNWAYKQADLQGYKRALSEVISLIS